MIAALDYTAPVSSANQYVDERSIHLRYRGNRIEKDSPLLFTIPIEANRYQKITVKLSEVGCLQNNWDGYEAVPPTSQVIQRAKQLAYRLPDYALRKIKSDDVTATPYGTVVFNIKADNNYLLSLEVGETKIGFFVEYNGEINNVIEGEIFNGITLPEKLSEALYKFAV